MTAAVCLPKCRRVWKSCPPCRYAANAVRRTMNKMAYVRPEYHDRIMRITRVIGHDRLSLSAYIDHVLTHHFNQCEEAIKSLYARNYDAVF